MDLFLYVVNATDGSGGQIVPCPSMAPRRPGALRRPPRGVSHPRSSSAAPRRAFAPAEDAAGNRASVTHEYEVIGGTRPTITIRFPRLTDVAFLLGQQVATDFSCADEPGGSGVVACEGDAMLDTATVGAKTFSVYARDAAGNETLVWLKKNGQGHWVVTHGFPYRFRRTRALGDHNPPAPSRKLPAPLQQLLLLRRRSLAASLTSRTSAYT